MARDRQPPLRDAGVRVTRRRTIPVLVPGLAVLGFLGWLILPPSPGTPTPPAAPPHPAAAAPAADTPGTAPPVPPDAPGATGTAGTDARHAEIVERARQRREERRDNQRSRTEPKFTLNAPGETAGLAAFPPPGSKPIKQGIVVPDDVELPPGYVRHYQTTDDGRRLPPILMYHPDVAGVDANGNPIAPPADRIVPPEEAPPGMPHRMLDATVDAGQIVGRQRHGDAPYETLPDVR